MNLLQEVQDLWDIRKIERKPLGRGLGSPTWGSSWRVAGKRAKKIIEKMKENA